MSCVVALMLLAAAAPAAAQWVDPDSCSMAEFSCQQAKKEKSDKAAQNAAQDAKDKAQEDQALLRLPPLPAERNVLLGSWRLEAGGQETRVTGRGEGKGTGGVDGIIRELWTSLESGKLLCIPMFGDGISFASSTYSIRAITGSSSGGSVDYRSTGKQGIVAITNWKTLYFKVEGANRITWASCALERVGAQGANAAANAATASSGAQLAVGPDAGGYLCPDGRQLYVEGCFDNSPDANCGVVLMHLPLQRGYQQKRNQTRSELTPSVAACKVYPLEFRKDYTVQLVLPKSTPQQQTAKPPAASRP
jgi:hypothetical protein